MNTIYLVVAQCPEDRGERNVCYYSSKAKAGDHVAQANLKAKAFAVWAEQVAMYHNDTQPATVGDEDNMLSSIDFSWQYAVPAVNQFLSDCLVAKVGSMLVRLDNPLHFDIGLFFEPPTYRIVEVEGPVVA